MRAFKGLEVYKRALEVTKSLYKLVKYLPDSEKFGLASQMTRAAVSVPSNIAEGCGRDHATDFKRFLSIAQGSLNELEAQLDIAYSVHLTENDEAAKLYYEIMANVQITGRLLMGLYRSVDGDQRYESKARRKPGAPKF